MYEYERAFPPATVLALLRVAESAKLLLDRPDFWVGTLPGEYDDVKDALAKLASI